MVAYRVAVAVGMPLESVRTVVMGAARALVDMVAVGIPAELVSVVTVGVDRADGVLVTTAVGTPKEFVRVVTCGVTYVGSIVVGTPSMVVGPISTASVRERVLVSVGPSLPFLGSVSVFVTI